MSIRLVTILAAAASLAGAGGSLAQTYYDEPPQSQSDNEVVVRPPYLPPGAELRSEAVFFGDLDLDSHAGANTLLRRINGAAQRVCSPPSRSLSDSSDYNRCMDEAVGRAVDQMDAPALNDVYQARFGYHRGGEGW